MNIVPKPGLALLLAAATLVSPPRLAAQSWKPTSAPITNWSAVACSADGSKLIAAVADFWDPGPIYTSTNFGTNWTLTDAPVSNWTAVASSADGGKLGATAALYYRGPIYRSMDSGGSWSVSETPPTNDWISVACSADGNMMFAAAPRVEFVPGGLYTSTDAGLTWTRHFPPDEEWGCVASSADGARLIAIGAGTYVSTNAGSVWTQVSNFALASSVAASSDGMRLVAAGSGGLFISTDGGITWTGATVPQMAWASVGASCDGIRFAAASANGAIYESADSGATWSPDSSSPTNFWSSVALSADGCRLVASVGYPAYGGIYTRQTTPHPVLKVASRGTNVVLLWITPSMPFVLQQSPGLNGVWSDVPTTPVLNYTNLHYEVSLPKPVGTVFYRLASR